MLSVVFPLKSMREKSGEKAIEERYRKRQRERKRKKENKRGRERDGKKTKGGEKESRLRKMVVRWGLDRVMHDRMFLDRMPT